MIDMRQGWIKYGVYNCHYVDDKLHNDNDPSIINMADGTKQWFKHGKRHREDGPALIKSVHKYWFINDVGHTEQEFVNWKKFKAFI